MGDTTTSYVPRDWRRVCDQCGIIFNRSRLHRKLSWIFCDICDQPGDRIQEQEDAAIARQRPFRILPVPNAKPQTVDSPYDWQAEEAQVFDLVALNAPARFIGGGSSLLGAAWGAVYMADIVIDARRPAVWIETAKTTIARCLSYLLSVQYGSPTGVAAVISNPRFGGFLDGGIYASSVVIAAGLAFIKGYSATGTIEYLNAAKRCATFIRHAQCRDLQTPYTSYPSAGGAYHVGGVSSQLDDSTSLLSANYAVYDVNAAQFLTELAEVIGSDAVFGDATSTAYFTAATEATLEEMISDVMTFAIDGAKDANNSGELTPGLSTTPYTIYVAASSDGSTGAGAWAASASIAGSTVASALAGIFAVDGADDETITAMLAWLAAFTANSANATPSTNTPQQTLDGITGTYDPDVAPATSLQATAPYTESTGAPYDLAALGMLAPILAQTDATMLRDARRELAPGQRFSTFFLDLIYPGTLGRAGLSLQPRTSASAVTVDIMLAAQFGNVFRYVNP